MKLLKKTDHVFSTVNYKIFPVRKGMITISFKRILLCLVVLVGATFLNFHCYAESFTLYDGFSYEDIPIKIQNLMYGKSYKENEYVKFEYLKLCKVRHIGFDGEKHEGKLIVAYQVESPSGETINIAKEVLEIFHEMYEANYPIEKIRLIDNYDADDECSMRDNNSSAFNFRYVIGTTKNSWHSYGLAIDINPQVNPCFHLDSKLIEPAGTEEFINRGLNQMGLIKKGDACYKAFTSRGWEWGGEWFDFGYEDCPIDYMHFQKFPRNAPTPKYIVSQKK